MSPTFPAGTLVTRVEDNAIEPRVMSAIISEVGPNHMRDDDMYHRSEHCLCGWIQIGEHGPVFRCKLFNVDELERLGNQNYEG